MTQNQLLELKSRIVMTFNRMDNLTPGDEEVEYQLEKIRDCIRNSKSYIQDIIWEQNQILKALDEIDSVVDEKIRNPYSQPKFDRPYLQSEFV